MSKYKTQARRTVSDKESARWLHGLQATSALQEKLPHTRLTCVTDREGDFYELLVAAEAAPVDFIIRAQGGRLLDDGRRISEPPEPSQALGTSCFEMAARPGRTRRNVTQTLWAQRCS
ncbi:MAG: IS4 family transposase, partial [Opitutaceae bacterium]